jgi:hypothetical protein
VVFLIGIFRLACRNNQLQALLVFRLLLYIFPNENDRLIRILLRVIQFVILREQQQQRNQQQQQNQLEILPQQNQLEILPQQNQIIPNQPDGELQERRRHNYMMRPRN